MVPFTFELQFEPKANPLNVDVHPSDRRRVDGVPLIISSHGNFEIFHFLQWVREHVWCHFPPLESVDDRQVARSTVHISLLNALGRLTYTIFKHDRIEQKQHQQQHRQI